MADPQVGTPSGIQTGSDYSHFRVLTSYVVSESAGILLYYDFFKINDLDMAPIPAVTSLSFYCLN